MVQHDGWQEQNEFSQHLSNEPINPLWNVFLIRSHSMHWVTSNPWSVVDLNLTWPTWTFPHPHLYSTTLIARFMGPTWGPYGADRTQVGPMLAPWTLLSGYRCEKHNHQGKKPTCCRHLLNIVCNSCDVRNLWGIHHDAKFVVIVGTNTCRYENPRYQQWRQTCLQKNLMVKVCVFIHNFRDCCTATRAIVLPPYQWSYTESCV